MKNVLQFSEHFYFLLNHTIDNDLLPVLRATVEVIDWYNLGLELGLPSYQLDIIQNDSRGVKDGQRMMFQKWLDTGSASWGSLVKALRSPLIKKERIADEIAKAHPCNN